MTAALALLWAVTAAPPGGSCERVDEGFGARGQVAIQAVTVVSGLEVPWSIAFLPGGDWLVTERAGRLRIVRGGKLLPDPIARVPAEAQGEGGLMGAAVAPDFARSRRVLLYYTAKTRGRPVNRLESWILSEDHRSARAERVLLDGVPGSRVHDGGRIRFGPDGKLYVATGDARDADLSQKRESLAGKLLRLEPDGGVPRDNPFPGSPVFLLGLRNLQAFDWAPDGTLAVADHGPSGEKGRRGHDEVTVAPPPGGNLGWPEIHGCEAREGLLTPALTWREAVPPGGAAFYTGDAIPEWKGSLLVGTLGSRHLHRIVLDRGRPARVAAHEVYLAGEPPEGLGRIRDVVMGPDRELYVTTSNCDGRGECPPDKDRIVRITR